MRELMVKADKRSPGRRSRQAADSRLAALPIAVLPRSIVIDPHRSFVFPNRIREQRIRHGYPKLLQLVSALPEIPYIRLSKIERGEVVARSDEVVRIAGVLGVKPHDLLIDVDAPGFDIDTWSKPFQQGKAASQAEEQFAVLLAAATRARRAQAADLTIAAIERDYGIAPVVLSRIENAAKTLDRWNDATIENLCRLFEVDNELALRRKVEGQHGSGVLDEFIGAIAAPDERLRKTRKLIAQLASELDIASVPAGATGVSALQAPAVRASAPERSNSNVPQAKPGQPARLRLLRVIGAPLADGLIAPTDTGLQVEAPRAAGPAAFGLRICRPTLGAGLPGNAIVVVDPDVFPSSGGLAVANVEGNYRLLAVTFNLSGAMIGHSINPALEVPLDSLDPSALAAVISATFI